MLSLREEAPNQNDKSYYNKGYCRFVVAISYIIHRGCATTNAGIWPSDKSDNYEITPNSAENESNDEY